MDQKDFDIAAELLKFERHELAGMLLGTLSHQILIALIQVVRQKRMEVTLENMEPGGNA